MDRLQARRSNRDRSLWVVIAVILPVMTACAPDTVRSVQATGFNAYMKKLGDACRPLQIGDADIGEWIRTDAMGNDNYAYFVDVTSKLYYNRLSPAGYRQAVVGFFGSGNSNDRAFDCIFRNLPPDRPNAPVGTY
jgi:hypothetical protein